eukprot:CAMPEP_0203806598 /NCGR_PEP_ID=MMETSP0115-20131106/576_1 /ASSEMBLY_ACC=CAM_ASM_000227 /TAXON_ID=33651 /ORGANISM="Bicosoecid sp, Strain ms1" /LENGTH=189 /DNA_ID=CAMNT_0050715259 /DNA_START=37 /DNA_END=606 /DNA_ORIENTATION=-
MGKDIVAGGRRVHHKNRVAAKSENVYINLLVQLYEFLSRRTNSGFNKIVLNRLKASKNNRPPLGLARLARYMTGNEDKIAVTVGTVTDDIRLEGLSFPKLTVCALRFTEGARTRIEANGGECLTFDQLALRQPKGTKTVLLRGRLTARTAYKYFGRPGTHGSTARPFIRAKGRKFEQARGRRRSRGFKI